jgi:hypothetical protein
LISTMEYSIGLPRDNETNERQPPVPIPPRLLAHLRRWKMRGIAREHFVEWNGKAVKSVKTAFKRAVKLAKLPGKTTPHTLRHTAATWLMQAGVEKWQAAGFLGMSIEMLDRVCSHHILIICTPLLTLSGIARANHWPYHWPRAGESPKTVQQAVENIGGPGRTRTSNQTVMSGRL